jgi:osmoprotectant transport system substrate-binding protein
VLTASLAIAACTSGDDSGANDTSATAATSADQASGALSRGEAADGEVIFAGFNFSESTILAHLYALAAEARGIPTEVRESVGPREVVQEMLFGGELEVVPEYLGGALIGVGGNATEDSEDSQEDLRQLMHDQGVAVLDLADATNRDAVAVTLDTATQFQLRAMSDLDAVAPDLTFGGPPECPDRKLCILGLEDTYGLTFHDFVALEPGLPTASALALGDIGAASVFTTDATISVFTLVLLDDDKGLYPAQNVVPVVREEVLEAYPELEDALNDVSDQLSTRDLRALNYTVAITGEQPIRAAQTWLEDKGIL